MTVRPFIIAVPQERLDWIAGRLRDAQWPTEATGDPWAYGASIPEVRALVDYWLTRYDWRAREAAMNRFPHYLASVEVDGAPYDIHFIHVPGKGPSPKPAIIIHGWPGSFVEFIDRAADRSGKIRRRSGGRALGRDPVADRLRLLVQAGEADRPAHHRQSLRYRDARGARLQRLYRAGRRLGVIGLRLARL
jgi:hypothetical protein